MSREIRIQASEKLVSYFLIFLVANSELKKPSNCIRMLVRVATVMFACNVNLMSINLIKQQEDYFFELFDDLINF